MPRVFVHLVFVLAADLAGKPPAAFPQASDVFSLRIEGPDVLAAPAGGTRRATCHATIAHAGTGSGAQGWSFGIASSGVRILSATFAGTAADFITNGGHRDPDSSVARFQFIDPAKNGGASGIVSYVTLSTSGLETAVLPPGSTQRVLEMAIEAAVPEGGGTAALEYRDGLVGAGQPVAIVVTQDGESARTSVSPLRIQLEDARCCGAPVAVGFSAEPIRDGHLFEGIAGAGEHCAADEGQIVTLVPRGSLGSTRVHVNIVANLEDAGIDGWSYGVALDGSADIESVTTRGTAADTIANGGYRDPKDSFAKTVIIRPENNGGHRGLVGAVAVISHLDWILPPVGTQSVCAVDLVAGAAQGAVDQTATLRFQGGLIGWDPAIPFDLVIGAGGNSAPVCNFNAARVDVVFRSSGPPEFRRGDANADGRVDIADPIWILGELFLGGSTTECPDAADANDDGAENASDAIFLFDYLFLDGLRTPPAPGPRVCGPDPTEDGLDCPRTQASCS
jgi:hypothetical protein